MIILMDAKGGLSSFKHTIASYMRHVITQLKKCLLSMAEVPLWNDANKILIGVKSDSSSSQGNECQAQQFGMNNEEF